MKKAIHYVKLHTIKEEIEMAKKKIVSIEDRIPKLKQARKKKANRRLIFYLSIFFILISIIVYLQSPLSDIHTVDITGNSLISDEEMVNIADLEDSPNIWTISKSDIKEEIMDYPLMKSAEVEKKLPQTIKIDVQEYDVVGYVEEDEYFFPVLENGEKLTELKEASMSGDAPLMLDFDEDEYLTKMTEELKELPQDIRKLISEIHWKPEDDNENKILLYMNDGFLVDGSIHEFSEKMQVYPSIVAQLSDDEKGIIHIGVGAYFEEFSSDEE